jgi:DNA ligase-1
LLQEVLPSNEHIVFVQHLEGHGEQYFNLVKEQGLEGIVLKRKDSKYSPATRFNDWLKVINYQYEDIIITGLRKSKFGVLLSFEDGSPAGIMEFMKPSDRKKLYSEFKRLFVDESSDYISKTEAKRSRKVSQPYKKGILTDTFF